MYTICVSSRFSLVCCVSQLPSHSTHRWSTARLLNIYITASSSVFSFFLCFCCFFHSFKVYVCLVFRYRISLVFSSNTELNIPLFAEEFLSITKSTALSGRPESHAPSSAQLWKWSRPAPWTTWNWGSTQRCRIDSNSWAPTRRWPDSCRTCTWCPRGRADAPGR